MVYAGPEPLRFVFEFNGNPDVDAVCTCCGGELPEDQDTCFIAVALMGRHVTKRICEDCSDRYQPGLWEIADGMDWIFSGLAFLPADRREPMLAKISRFLEAVATGLPAAPAVDAESWRTVLTSVAAAIPTRVTATYVQPAELRKTLAAGPFVETTTDSGIRQFLDQTGHVVAEADGAGYLDQTEEK